MKLYALYSPENSLLAGSNDIQKLMDITIDNTWIVLTNQENKNNKRKSVSGYIIKELPFVN